MHPGEPYKDRNKNRTGSLEVEQCFMVEPEYQYLILSPFAIAVQELACHMQAVGHRLHSYFD